MVAPAETLAALKCAPEACVMIPTGSTFGVPAGRAGKGIPASKNTSIVARVRRGITVRILQEKLSPSVGASTAQVMVLCSKSRWLSAPGQPRCFTIGGPLGTIEERTFEKHCDFIVDCPFVVSGACAEVNSSVAGAGRAGSA